MRRGFFISLIIHTAVTIIAYLGLPYLNPEPSIADIPVFVEVVNVANQPNPPPSQSEPDPSMQKTAELSSVPAEPMAEPEVAPMVKPKPDISELPPEPERYVTPAPETKPLAHTKPKPNPKAKLALVRPPKKPKPPDAFASVLKTLEAMEKAKIKRKNLSENSRTKETDYEEAIAVALKSNAKHTFDSNLPVSMTETDAVRKHFEECWNVPAGAKGADGMVVELEIRFLQDGSVRSVKIVNTARMRLDPFYRITAEAAQRAVLHPKCNKLSMPPDRFPDWQAKYKTWQSMTLVFDPKDMF